MAQSIRKSYLGYEFVETVRMGQPGANIRVNYSCVCLFLSKGFARSIDW